MHDIDELPMVTADKKIERIHALANANLTLAPLARKFPAFDDELGVAPMDRQSGAYQGRKTIFGGRKEKTLA